MYRGYSVGVFIISKILNRIVKIKRVITSQTFIFFTRLRFPEFTLSGNNKFQEHVYISATDGGSIKIGRSTSVCRYAAMYAESGKLVIGDNVHVGIGVVLAAKEKIEIGNDVLIAEYVTIRDQDHNFSAHGSTAENGFTTASVNIANGVWIGAKATITKGVSIGENSVIGANSVVTNDIPANCVAVGAPARVIGSC